MLSNDRLRACDGERMAGSNYPIGASPITNAEAVLTTSPSPLKL